MDPLGEGQVVLVARQLHEVVVQVGDEDVGQIRVALTAHVIHEAGVHSVNVREGRVHISHKVMR